jgi:hypothetical protein
MTTIISTGGVHKVTDRPDGTDLWLTPQKFEAVTGFALKPEGFCRDAVCIPIPPGRERHVHHGRKVNIAAFAELTHRPWVGTESGDCWVLEEPADARDAALRSLEAPDFALPDLDGRTHRLSDYRGSKVLLASWASW